MTRCKRCLRDHRGICGIPAGVIQGFGARVAVCSTIYPLNHSRPNTKMKGTPVLDELLTQAQTELVKVMDMLQKVPPEMIEEYTALLDREGKLNFVVKQLYQQIGVARSKG